MSYKLIVVDLDDSLLGSDLKISPKNHEALVQAMDQGVLVTIATGRMFRSAVVYARQLGLDVPIITYQGGLIKSTFSNKVLYNQTLGLDVSKKIVDLCRAKGLYLQIYMGDEYYIEEPNAYSRKYHKQVGVEGIVVGPLDKFLKEPPNKLLIMDEPGRIPEFGREFTEILGDQIEITTSKPEFLEFTHRDATKGRALEYLATTRGIPKDEIIAIGDSFNDISMISYAGLGIVMGNAPMEVQEYADYVTGTNDDDGVAQAIDKFILKRG
ncbi:MAG TPA: Cof-type HAD-IIB family hydrolase [Clostridia bacterium]|nr:Cof-type HAD-IIB family hydrolase [Clostridia bacterium]